MGTRKNKKPNKRFRKTRSKRQRGGRLTQKYNNQEDDPNNALEEPAYQDVPNNEEWVRQLDCPLNNFDEREVEYRWQQQTNRGLPRGAGHLSGNKAMWRDICQDFVRDLTPDQIRRRLREQIRRRQSEEEIAERRHRETNGGKRRKTRSKRQRGGDSDSESDFEPEYSWDDAMRDAIFAGAFADENDTNRQGLTQAEEVKLALEKGVDVNLLEDEYNTNTQTILMRASEDGDTHIVKILLDKKYGADVNKKTHRGWTALHYACKTKYNTTFGKEKKLEVVRMLLDAGADINAKTRGGETALDIANENGDRNLVKFLKQYADASALEDVRKHIITQVTEAKEYRKERKDIPELQKCNPIYEENKKKNEKKYVEDKKNVEKKYVENKKKIEEIYEACKNRPVNKIKAASVQTPQQQVLGLRDITKGQIEKFLIPNPETNGGKRKTRKSKKSKRKSRKTRRK